MKTTENNHLCGQNVNGQHGLALTLRVAYPTHISAVAGLWAWVKERFSITPQVMSPPSQKPFSLNVDACLPCDGITAVVGESGAGKSTLLHCIAGLHRVGHMAKHPPCIHEASCITANGDVWLASGREKPAHLREVGFVFQSPSLFPHLNVERNIRYGLKRRSQQSDVQAQTSLMDAVLSILDISQLLDRPVSELSGGEQQRVAIARALVSRPKVLLMDEPLASLDRQRKSEVLPYLDKIQKAFSIPIVYVSHSLDEVIRLADYVLLLQRGEQVGFGPVQEILPRILDARSPDEETAVVLEVVCSEIDSEWQLMSCAFASVTLTIEHTEEKLGDKLRLKILARDVSVSLEEQSQVSLLNRFSGIVQRLELIERSPFVLIHVERDGQIFLAKITRKSAAQLNLCEGMKVWLQIKSAAIVR